MNIIYKIVVGLFILLGQFHITIAQVYYGQRLLGQRVSQRSSGQYVSAFESMMPLNYRGSHGYYDRVILYYDCSCPFYGYAPYYTCECYSCGC